MGKTIFSLFQFVILGLACNPMIALASEGTTETSKSSTSNPIAAFIALIVFLVVTYTVYKAMYSGTAIIGTRNGIAAEKGRMLFVPSIIGLIVAGIVYKLVNFLLVVLVIVAIVGGLFFIIKKYANKNNSPLNSTENNINRTIEPLNTTQHNTNMNTESVASEFRECPNCHKMIQMSSKFCKFCGKNV